MPNLTGGTKKRERIQTYKGRKHQTNDKCQLCYHSDIFYSLSLPKVKNIPFLMILTEKMELFPVHKMGQESGLDWDINQIINCFIILTASILL